MQFKSVYFIFFVWTSLQCSINGKVYSRCELANELKKNDFPMSFISNWVCLAENESGRNTSYITKTPLYNLYGIFQISSKDWCGKGYYGEKCNIRCEDFLSDDITKDMECAKKIFNADGFKWWKRWETNCKKKPLPNVSTCFFHLK